MKKIFTFLTLSLLTIINLHAIPSNSVSSNGVATASAIQSSSTNIDQAIVSLLGGVQAAGTEIYGASKDVFTNSISFVEGQATDIISQYLQWRMFECTYFAIICLVVSSIGFWKARCFFKKTEDNDFHGTVGCWLGGISFIVFIGFILNVNEIVQIWIAPKVYLLEYLSNLIKQSHS